MFSKLIYHTIIRLQRENMIFKKVYLYITLVMCRAGSKESAGLFVSLQVKKTSGFAGELIENFRFKLKKTPLPL